MDQHIKAMGELDKLLTETTSPTVLKADLAKFKRISDILNSRTNIPKDFVKALRSKIMSLKHPRSQLMLFELMEYTTCKCPGPIHTEYNNKEFLQVLNSVFNQAQLGDEVRNKLLGLIQFWNVTFESRKDIFPNFSWYYNVIQSRGVPFPPFKPSPYGEGKQAMGTGQAPQNTRAPAGFESAGAGGFGGSSGSSGSTKDDAMFETLDPKQKKLFKDLSVVLENVQLANSMMDANERELDEVVGSIAKMQAKLQPLPDRLLEANEGFLHAYCVAILEDTNFTLNRYQRFAQRQPAPKFNSQAEQVIEQARQMFAQQSQPQQSNDLGNPQFVDQGHDHLQGQGQFDGGFAQPQHNQAGFDHGFGDHNQQPQQGFGDFHSQHQQQDFNQGVGHGGFEQGFGGFGNQVGGHDQHQQQQGFGGFGDFSSQGQQQQGGQENAFGGPSNFEQNKQQDPFGGF
jgi:hypothetical protein